MGTKELDSKSEKQKKIEKVKKSSVVQKAHSKNEKENVHAKGKKDNTKNDDDRIDQAGWESFPASDPPAY